MEKFVTRYGNMRQRCTLECQLANWCKETPEVISIRKQKHELLGGLQQGVGKPSMGEKAVDLTYVEHESQS